METKKCLWIKDCPNPPGGKWSPYFCPTHDEERVKKISKQLENLERDLKRS